jgi:hypothetical protein
VTNQPKLAGESKWEKVNAFVLGTYPWRLFYLILTVLAAVSAYVSPTENIRVFALGTLFLALVSMLGMLMRDLFRLMTREHYERERAYDLNARFYGLSYESLEVEGTLHLDGSMVIRRTMKLLAFNDRVEKVDHYMLAREAPAAGQSIKAKITGRQTRNVELDLYVYLQAPDRSYNIVIFKPPLRRNEVAEYVYEEVLPAGSFAMKGDDLPPHMPYEYVAWDITRPTKNFVLRVVIPKGANVVTSDHDVWFGVTRMSHEREYGRVHGGYSESETNASKILTISVAQPVLGLTYVIKWLPAGGEDSTHAVSGGNPV